MSFLSLHLNEILQSEIKQKLFSVQKTTCITAIADKKIISVLYVSGVLCASPHSVVLIKQFLQLGSIFSRNPQLKRKKPNQQLHLNYKRFFKDVIYLFSCQGHLKLSILSKSGNDTYNRG